LLSSYLYTTRVGYWQQTLVYRTSAVDVDRKSTDRRSRVPRLAGLKGKYSVGGDYHQQYLAKNPNGCCGIGGCGAPFKLAELPVGKKV
jgi:peptide methionine sulfoxide reductase MsrA